MSCFSIPAQSGHFYLHSNDDLDDAYELEWDVIIPRASVLFITDVPGELYEPLGLNQDLDHTLVRLHGGDSLILRSLTAKDLGFWVD